MHRIIVRRCMCHLLLPVAQGLENYLNIPLGGDPPVG